MTKKQLSPQDITHFYLLKMGVMPYPEIVEAFTATCMYEGTREQVDRVGTIIKPLLKTPFNELQEQLYALHNAGIKYRPIDTGTPF